MRSRVLPLAAWAAVAVAAGLAWLSVGGTSAATTVEEEPPADVTARGDTLYTIHCARCHAADGTGGAGPTGTAPPLVGMEAARVDLVLRTGRMPPAEPDGSGHGRQWSDQERETLLAHMTALFDLQGPLFVPEHGDPAVGREVFATHCAACHGYTGDGGVAGGGVLTPNLLGLEPAVIAEAVRVGPFQMPQFAEQQVADEELGDIVAYLDEVAAERTTVLGVGELNPVYLAAFAALLAIAVVLSCMFIAGRVAMFPDPGPGADADRDADRDADEEAAG